MRRFALILTAMLAAAMLLPAMAEEDAELSFDDLYDGVEEEVIYNDVIWDFPVSLDEMDPVFVRLANKHMLLGKNDKPVPLVTVKERKSAKDGSNANGGVRKASGSKMQLQGDCYDALVRMFDAADEDGIHLYLKSAYRSWQTQNTMYYNRLKRNNGRDDGWVSKPGASDHQTGLGCDIVSRSWRDRSLNGDFGKTPEAQWMAEHCHEFGFILRYPADKEDITEINYEPWHFRYVGVPAATYIMENGLCLEEFHEKMDKAIDQFIADGGPLSVVKPFIQVSAGEE